MEHCEYQNMTPQEFVYAIKKMPVFFVPLGLLEWHGEHLPLGTDMLKAHGICLRVIKALGGGIVLPSIYIGRPGFSSYTGTLTFSESIVNGMLYELMGQLQKVGAKVIVLLTGHYGPLQLDCVKRAGQCFAQENPTVQVLVQAEYEGVLVQGEIPADHAGLWESSLMYALYPKTRINHVESKCNLKVAQYETFANNYYQESSNWVWHNDVTSATASKGEAALLEIVGTLAKKIQLLLHLCSRNESLL